MIREDRAKELARLRYEIDAALGKPSELNVGEFDQLQRRYNLLLQQIEAERNLHSVRQCVASEREAVSKLVRTP